MNQETMIIKKLSVMDQDGSLVDFGLAKRLPMAGTVAEICAASRKAFSSDYAGTKKRINFEGKNEAVIYRINRTGRKVIAAIYNEQ